MSTEFLLSIASFLESKRKASALVLALLLFFIAAVTGFTEVLKDALRNVELPPYAVAASLLVFCYAIALLILFALTWVLSLSARTLKSVSAFLVSTYHALRSAYAARQLAKRRIANAVAAFSPQERAFLELFSADGVALQRTAYELLPHPTYMAHWSLVTNGLIVKTASTRGSSVERFALATEILPTLRRLFYGGKRPIPEIDLRLDRVAASVASGGGARGA